MYLILVLLDSLGPALMVLAVERLMSIASDGGERGSLIVTIVLQVSSLVCTHPAKILHPHVLNLHPPRGSYQQSRVENHDALTRTLDKSNELIGQSSRESPPVSAGFFVCPVLSLMVSMPFQTWSR